MRTRSFSWSVLVVATLALAASYLKFSRCISVGWLTPDVYLQGCYTDLTPLYEARNFATDAWPYGSGASSLEYPVLSGLGIWLISLLTKDGSAGLLEFFRWNLFALSCAYAIVVFQLSKLDRKNGFLCALAPAVISALFINWDLWAVAPLVLSLVFVGRGRYTLAGVLLSISIFFKFFPVIYILPIVLFLAHNRVAQRQFLKGLLISAAGINIPILVVQFDGWFKFYRFNFEREVDFGSIWYLISMQGSWISHLNWIAAPIILALLIGCSHRYRDNLLGNIFLVSVIFFTLNKVYSPQYVIWLAVVAILYFPKTRTFLGLFVLWQGGELLYQFGIWRHILTVLGEGSGIANSTYISITLFRITTLLLLAGYALYLLENDFIKSRNSEANI